MRPLSELVNTEEPAWPMVQEWIADAKNAVEVLPVNPAERDAALTALQVTTRSPMGAIVYETGGILIDHGWLRILGSGHPRLPRSLPSWNKGRTMFDDENPPGYLLVADDVVGGFFAVNGGALGPEMGRVFYFAPDSLEWERMEFGYGQFLFWCLQGNVTMFYESLRWPGWENEITTLNGDQAIFVFPFLATKGPPLEQRHHGVVPVAEMFALHVSGDALEDPSPNS
jgi:uncharacterized protein DUF2625